MWQILPDDYPHAGWEDTRVNFPHPYKPDAFFRTGASTPLPLLHSRCLWGYSSLSWEASTHSSYEAQNAAQIFSTVRVRSDADRYIFLASIAAALIVAPLITLSAHATADTAAAGPQAVHLRLIRSSKPDYPADCCRKRQPGPLPVPWSGSPLYS